MPDYAEGIKKEVAEVKFLIHDLRVESVLNDILHFHVTLNTDLEIYNIHQAQVLHEADVQELRMKLGALRKVNRDYSNAVMSFSPDRMVLLLGRRYINNIREVCELILNPLWGRSDKALSFLPAITRSVSSRRRYRNCIGWLYGVYRRIDAFIEEQESASISEEFDIAQDIRDFTRDVVLGYVVEKSESRVWLQLDRLDSAVITGNRQRFRRMYFNLVMNAVDAMSERKEGVLDVSTAIERERVALRVRDDGAGMPPERIQQLLTDPQTLDGELHSLGFVFVRQTVAQFGSELAIESAMGKGTTVTLLLPYVPGKVAEEPRHHYGKLVLEAYQNSKAQVPGSIFVIAIAEDNRVGMFAVKPYEHYRNISHEVLSPMYLEATHRGRMEEDELKRAILILEPPQTIRDYFDFKQVPEADRGPERFKRMVHDECIRIARTLIATGLDSQMPLYLRSASRFFDAPQEFLGTEPFELDLLARHGLSPEKSG